MANFPLLRYFIFLKSGFHLLWIKFSFEKNFVRYWKVCAGTISLSVIICGYGIVVALYSSTGPGIPLAIRYSHSLYQDKRSTYGSGSAGEAPAERLAFADALH